MMKYIIYSLTLLLLSSLCYSQKQVMSNNFSSPQGDSITAYLNLNNISTVFKNNGISDINAAQNNAGFVYPKGTGKTAVFTSGLVWGAFLPGDPQVRVGGSIYWSGLQGGKILFPGVAENPNASHVRIYRVRPDVFPGGPFVDLTVEADDEGKSQAEVRAQYELDWIQWRSADGAPFDDVDGNSLYDPNIDVPGVKGASQTIWFVANDLDPDLTLNFFGTVPIGIEYQATIWEYKDSLGFDNLFFRKYKLINKSNTSFNEMYVSMWSDPDIGNFVDDFVGCDTVLNLGYAYNSSNTDTAYAPLTPPVVEFQLIRGPIVPGNPGEDKNRNGIEDIHDYGLTENNQNVSGFINLPMTAFYYFTTNSSLFIDPQVGTTVGANQFYNFMQGRIGLTGDRFIDPLTNIETTFALNGNPVTGEGWIDGIVEDPWDRRLGLSTGPFQMAPGDTQIVVFAEIAGGVIDGADYLSAIDTVKKYSVIAQNFYDAQFPLPVSVDNKTVIPQTMELYQNYPNPFNPSTKIKYSIPKESYITLKIYNTLGEEVAELVNETKPAGNYEVEFTAEDFSSGVYISQLGVNDYLSTRKMLLMK